MSDDQVESAEPKAATPETVSVVDEDVSVVVQGRDPAAAADASPRGPHEGELVAVSERLRKVEEELAGVFETVGRLLGRIEALEAERPGRRADRSSPAGS